MMLKPMALTQYLRVSGHAALSRFNIVHFSDR